MTKENTNSEGSRSAAETRSRHSLLRLFGSARELVAKADSDLSRLVNSLTRGEQREALWALMDCAVVAFHIGDWLRATHTDHHASSHRFAQRSQWIRMTRDICHAAKHGDLQWADAATATQGPVVVRLEYEANVARDGQRRAEIWVVTSDQHRRSVVDVLRNAISDWVTFLDQRGI